MSRIFIAMLVMTVLGCSVTAYSPLVVNSALGLDRRSLNEEPGYRELIDRPLTLPIHEERIWTLRRFAGGRYFIELSLPEWRGTPFICELETGRVVINEIFEDTQNGGLFYSARASCDGQQWQDAPINHWYPQLLNQGDDQ